MIVYLKSHLKKVVIMKMDIGLTVHLDSYVNHIFGRMWYAMLGEINQCGSKKNDN